MAPLLAEFGARLREVDIDADPQLRELYNLDVPVIFLAGRKVAKHRVDLEAVQAPASRSPKPSRPLLKPLSPSPCLASAPAFPA